MLDPSGNEIDKVTENSIQMRAFVMANKLDKAVWDITHPLSAYTHTEKALLL